MSPVPYFAQSPHSSWRRASLIYALVPRTRRIVSLMAIVTGGHRQLLHFVRMLVMDYHQFGAYVCGIGLVLSLLSRLASINTN